MPPSPMMIPCVVAPAAPTVGEGPAAVGSGVAIAGAEPASAVDDCDEQRKARAHPPLFFFFFFFKF